MTPSNGDNPSLRRTLGIFLGAIFLVALASAATQQAHAAAITWIGGNANWDALNANWNPADEPDADDEAIFNTPNTVNMTNATDTISALTLSGGIDLNMNGNDLTVNGLVQLVDASTTLIIGGSTSLLAADSVTINNGGTIRLTGGTLSMAEETGSGSFVVATGGTLTGNGSINLNDAGVPAGTVLLTLSGGNLTATSTTPSDLFGSTAATLTINVADADGRIDLDNVSADINISRNDTLEINGASHGTNDPYSGTLNLAEGSTIDMSVAWQTDSALINANTGGIIVGSVGTPATITGAAFTFGGGTINLDAVDSLRLSAPFTTTAGTINNAGLLIFNAATTIGAGTDFQMTGNSAALTVESGVTVNIDDADFDPSGNNTAANIITINNGVLDIDWGAGSGDTIGNVINLNGGTLSVTSQDNTWAITGNMNVGANSPTSQINGEEVTFTSTSVTVGANSYLDINAPSVWGPTGNLVINAGGRVDLDGNTVTFSSAGTFTGSGLLTIGGGGLVQTATTFNMPSGTVELDGGDAVVNGIGFNANLTINVGTMAPFGDLAADTLSFGSFASLTVNLTNPNAEWTIGPNAVVTVNAIGGMLGGGGIQGSDVNVEGTVNISGNSIWNARVDLTGTVNVALDGSWNLRGGTLADLNRIEGGTITGAGVLNALVDEGLAGFGTIATDIEFANNTVLFAADGILNVNAPIVDVGIIGTADTDGILNVTVAWNTSVTTEVNLAGGELRGALITNAGAGGISGHGLLSAQVINTTFIAAESGTLVVETAANNNDWDGTGNGQLRGITGNLEIVDNAVFPFTGSVVVNQDHEVFVNGFELEFEPASDLILGSGIFRANVSTDFGGTMTVAVPVGGPSILRTAGGFNFETGSIITLNGNLELEGGTTLIQPGANFGGPGALINLATRTLRPLDGVTTADLSVLVINQGLFRLGTAGTTAQVQGADFQQTATGTSFFEFAGVALNQFDRLNLNGAAALSGTLNLALLGGFAPAAGQSFNILTANGGIGGAFTSVVQPAGMPAGLAFSVSYSPFIVQLTVTTTYEAWINSFTSLTIAADKLKTADPDGDKQNNLVEFALDGNPTNALPTGKVVVKIAPVAGVNALTLTLPVRTGATLDPADPAGGPLVLKQTGDAVSYSIQASDELTTWTLDVTEVVGADATSIQTGLPALNPGWVYRTFRSPGPVAGDPIEFMRIVIGE
jgi:hypothetical protein